MGTCINFAGVPAIQNSHDPLPAWRMLYARGKKFALISIATTSVTALTIFYKKGDLRYLTCAGLSLLIIPYTLKFMKPTNDALFELKDSNPEETRKTAKRLITTWSGLQWVRTVLSISVFVIGINAVVYK